MIWIILKNNSGHARLWLAWGGGGNPSALLALGLTWHHRPKWHHRPPCLPKLFLHPIGTSLLPWNFHTISTLHPIPEIFTHFWCILNFRLLSGIWVIWGNFVLNPVKWVIFRVSTVLGGRPLSSIWFERGRLRLKKLSLKSYSIFFMALWPF